MFHPKTTLLSYIRPFFFSSCLLCFFAMTGVVDAKLVFRIGDDLYVSNDDGSRRRRITHNTQGVDKHPRWSPDGEKIAFTRFLNKKDMKTTQRSAELFIINADGTDPQRLTHNNFLDTDTAWSPDGRQITFSSTRTGSWEVFVMELATHSVRQLTRAEEGADTAGSAAPDWSPDGRHIIFERFLRVEGGFSPKTIYIMSADGQNQRPLVQPPAPNDPLTMNFFPRWSADGKRIVFYESKWFRDGGISKLIVKRIIGGKQEITEINDRLGNDFLIAGASWIAEDRSIVFSLKFLEKPNANYDLYRYDLQTHGLRRLTSTAQDETRPDWTAGALSVSPHGKVTTLWGELKQPEH